MSSYDYAIVGAGFTGSTCAALLKRAGYTVLVVDEREVIGGTSADKIDDLGYVTSLFGPHAFHTNSIEVFNFLSQFTEWMPYTQISLSKYRDEYYEIPINANTIEKFFKVKFHSEEECRAFLDTKKVPQTNITNSMELGLSTMGPELFEAFYWNYTCKQWNTTPDMLHRSVVGRLPVRVNRDARYFTDSFQFMPIGGYTQMMTRMLDGCDVIMGRKISLKEVREDAEKIIWTGPLDEAFDQKFGRLTWRGLHWNWYESDTQLPAAVVHETDKDVPWVRSMDTSYFNNEFKGRTTIIQEFSNDRDAFYPVLKPGVDKILEAYQREAKITPNLYCIGRMGRFRYIDMHQAVSDALAWVKGELGFANFHSVV